MQVILSMTANQLLVFGKRYITLDDTGTLSCCSFVRLYRVLWKLQRSTTMANREIGFGKWHVGAGKQFFLQWAICHTINQIVRA